jgi:ABC-type nitrate/sulfonate/bicarbonate transport system ATPase subunit
LPQIGERERTTVLFVTHSIDYAVFLADRIAVFGQQPDSITATVTVELSRPCDPETSKRYCATPFSNALATILPLKAQMPLMELGAVFGLLASTEVVSDPAPLRTE